MLSTEQDPSHCYCWRSTDVPRRTGHPTRDTFCAPRSLGAWRQGLLTAGVVFSILGMGILRGWHSDGTEQVLLPDTR